MELRHLRYFVAVAEAENFHRAAEKLHVSQSPLSRQMQQLRKEVGVDLLEPAGRGVKLTPAGRLFLERARAIVASADAAIEDAREVTGGETGTVVIGFEAGAAYAGSLSTIVTELRRRRPRVAVKLHQLTSNEQWDALRKRDIDFAYGNYVPEDATLRSLVLARSRIGLLLPRTHRLAARARLKVSDLANEPVMMEPRRIHPRLHDDLIAAVRARGVVLALAPEVADREALWTLVASGLGITFAGERGARIPLGDAVWRPLSDLGVHLQDVVAWRGDGAPSPLVRALVEIVAELRRR